MTLLRSAFPLAVAALLAGPFATGCSAPADGSSDATEDNLSSRADRCSGAPTTNVGYRVLDLGGGLKAGAWYPTSDAAHEYAYNLTTWSQVAKNGALPCGQHPLLVFSHAIAGCGLQSVFLTESLARQGFVVIAPDHRDALLCRIDNGILPSRPPNFGPPVFLPGLWSDRSYTDRRDDIENIIDQMTTTHELAAIVDKNKIGLVGHSLGGYTMLGIAGAWPSWKDSRVKAVLALSPFVAPLLRHGAISNVTVPVFYQGAEGDGDVTPTIDGRNGAYAKTQKPRYFAVLPHGTHVEWTNLLCTFEMNTADCLEDRDNAHRIVDLSTAFLGHYLQHQDLGILHGGTPGLASYTYDD